MESLAFISTLYGGHLIVIRVAVSDVCHLSRAKSE